MQDFGNVRLGKISNVRTVGGNTDCYFCKIEMEVSGEPPEIAQYAAVRTDTVPTGQWVYQQIVEGNFEGELIEIKARKSRIGTSNLTLMDDGCEDLNEINTISLK